MFNDSFLAGNRIEHAIAGRERAASEGGAAISHHNGWGALASDRVFQLPQALDGAGKLATH